jgi:chromosome segregation ATPase
LEKEVSETNKCYNRSVEGLSSELDRADELEAQSHAIQNECSKACENAEAVEAEKGKLEAEVEKLEAEKAKTLKA